MTRRRRSKAGTTNIHDAVLGENLTGKSTTHLGLRSRQTLFAQNTERHNLKHIRHSQNLAINVECCYVIGSRIRHKCHTSRRILCYTSYVIQIRRAALDLGFRQLTVRGVAQNPRILYSFCQQAQFFLDA